MRLFLILLTIISFGAFGSVSNVMLDGSIANTGIETIRGNSVPIGRNKVMLPSDMENLLLNGSFEHQTATQGWSLTSLASSTASTSDVFDGKKKVCLSGIGSIFQMLSDTDKYHGRKFIARFNIQNPQGKEGKACIYDGEDLHKCVQIQKSDEFREYVTGDTFIEGKSYGVIVNSLELDDICVDAVPVKLDPNEAYEAVISNDTDWVSYTPTITTLSGTMTNYTTTGMWRRVGDSAEIQARIDFTGSVGTWSGVRISLPSGLVAESSKTVNATNGVGTAAIGGIPYPLITDAGSGQIGIIALGVDVGTVPNKGFALGSSFPAAFTSGSYIRVSRTVPIQGWSARSKVINYPDETFSTDVNPVYWKATPCGDDEIGCYNTYSYVENTNTKTLCASRPDQSDADMRMNGVRIYTRAYTAPSTCALPAVFEFVLPKDLSEPTKTLYKDTSRSITGNTDYSPDQNVNIGIALKAYNPRTGKMTIDAGRNNASNTVSQLIFSDGSTQTNGYLVISATKNGGSLVNKPARYPVYVSGPEMMPSWYIVYSDGWVEQGSNQAGGAGVKTVVFPISMKDNNYMPTVQSITSSEANINMSVEGVHTLTTTSMRFKIYTEIPNKRWSIKGYGSASYLLDNFGIKVNY